MMTSLHLWSSSLRESNSTEFSVPSTRDQNYWKCICQTHRSEIRPWVNLLNSWYFTYVMPTFWLVKSSFTSEWDPGIHKSSHFNRRWTTEIIEGRRTYPLHPSPSSSPAKGTDPMGDAFRNTVDIGWLLSALLTLFVWSHPDLLRRVLQYQLAEYQVSLHLFPALNSLTKGTVSGALASGVMSSPTKTSWISPCLSCVTLLLFCAGFLRVELRMNQYDARLQALESRDAPPSLAIRGESGAFDDNHEFPTSIHSFRIRFASCPRWFTSFRLRFVTFPRWFTSFQLRFVRLTFIFCP